VDEGTDEGTAEDERLLAEEEDIGKQEEANNEVARRLGLNIKTCSMRREAKVAAC
jgi:hypothetical protein